MNLCLPVAFLLLAAALAGCAGTGAPTAPAMPSSTFVPAHDPAFRYEGRLDDSDPARPALIWQGTRVAVAFEGPQLALRFEGLQEQVFFDATVDGASWVIELRGPADLRAVCPLPLGPGRHELRLFKRSEASKGFVRFTGLELAPGAKVAALPPPSYRVAFQFFGDSITAGACNEDPGEDQWTDYRTHNNAKSYAAFTAAAFQADYRNVAVSGTGIVAGWTEPAARHYWNRLYFSATAPLADLTRWTPDVVFVNYGENDSSFTSAQQLPFPPTFAAEYVSLVRAIRQAYPRSQIVLLRGGMFGGARDPRLRAAWEKAVAELEASDPHLTHFVFQHWSAPHPRVADARAMADELIAWLKQQPFLAGRF